jgi:YVTN family beta-propeller protein
MNPDLDPSRSRRARGLQALGVGVCVALACGGDTGTTPGTGDTTDTGETEPATDTPPADTTDTPPADTSTTDVPTTDPSTGEPLPTSSTDPTTGDPTTGDPTTDTTTDAPPVVAPGPSKGGAIAVNAAGDTLAVANKGTDDVTLFALADGVAPMERARVAVGDEPVSVAWSPDGHTLYVVDRASADVARVVGADTDAPTVDGTVAVGREPIHGALSPVGSRLYVSSWVDGTLHVVDTAGLTVTDTVDLGGTPHAVCVTNSGDDDEDDETVFVTDFYARPIAGQKEATDGASQGRVFRVRSGDLGVEETALAPLPDAGIPQTPGAGVYPNQLYACAVHMGHVYVTGVGASPKSFNNGTDFKQNVHGMVHAIDLASGAEDPARTNSVIKKSSKGVPDKHPFTICFALKPFIFVGAVGCGLVSSGSSGSMPEKTSQLYSSFPHRVGKGEVLRGSLPRNTPIACSTAKAGSGNRVYRGTEVVTSPSSNGGMHSGRMFRRTVSRYSSIRSGFSKAAS